MISYIPICNEELNRFNDPDEVGIENPINTFSQVIEDPAALIMQMQGNLVRTFGDDELKSVFEKMVLTKLPMLISEVQHHIDNINQKEMFANENSARLLINDNFQENICDVTSFALFIFNQFF